MPVAVGATEVEPASPSLPLQAPLPVQPVALVLDQVSVELAPVAIEVGLAAIVTVGFGAAATVTVADAFALPPVPVQVRVYVLFPVGATEADPLTSSVPLQAPLAVQAVAFVLDQVNSEVLPLVTDVGLAAIVTVGFGGAVTVTAAEAFVVPPVPEQDSV